MEREVERRLASEADYEQALDEIERYFDNEPKRGTPQAARFDQLARQIASYEDAHWPIGRARRVRTSPSLSPEEPMAKRTTHRSTKGTKLYAVRDKEGKFEDIQTYKRAHRADVKRKSKAETAAKKKAVKKKVAKKK